MLQVSKKTILLAKGDFCKYAYKTVLGCLKSYVIDTNGKEYILQFAPEDWFISDLDSLLNQKPSSIFIEAIEATTLIRISKEELEQIDKEAQNLKLVKNLISLNSRLIALLSASAEERYLDFINTYPSLINRLPLKLIAAYIGITPEYLSEIRRQLTKK